MTYELSINRNGKKETIPFTYLMNAETEYINIMRDLKSNGWNAEKLADRQHKFTKDGDWIIITIYMYTC